MTHITSEYEKINNAQFAHLVVRNCKHLIWANATWAYSLSTPVTCLNAMQAIADKHSEAEESVWKS